MKDYADIIYSPVITEKSALKMQNDNVYTFKVAKSATKPQIKTAIERAFGVKVESVNTLNTKAKKSRVGKYTGMTKTYKKAIVTLAKDSKIEL